MAGRSRRSAAAEVCGFGNAALPHLSLHPPPERRRWPRHCQPLDAGDVLSQQLRSRRLIRRGGGRPADSASRAHRSCLPLQGAHPPWLPCVVTQQHTVCVCVVSSSSVRGGPNIDTSRLKDEPLPRRLLCHGIIRVRWAPCTASAPRAGSWRGAPACARSAAGPRSHSSRLDQQPPTRAGALTGNHVPPPCPDSHFFQSDSPSLQHKCITGAAEGGGGEDDDWAAIVVVGNS